MSKVENQTQTQAMINLAVSRTLFELSFGGKKKRTKLVNGAKVELEPFTAKTVKIDLQSLPAASVDKLIEYGLTQYLGDGSAGAESQSDFESGIDAKLAKLSEGDFSRKTGERNAGSVIESEDKLTMALIKSAIKSRLDALPPEARAAYSKEKRAEMAQAIYADADKCAKYRAQAATQIAATKALASDDDILAGL